MDAKNTCDGRRNDRSHMDYKGADDVQDAFSIVSVHDPETRKCPMVPETGREKLYGWY